MICQTGRKRKKEWALECLVMLQGKGHFEETMGDISGSHCLPGWVVVLIIILGLRVLPGLRTLQSWFSLPELPQPQEMPASHSMMLSTSFDLLDGSPCYFEYESQLSAAVAKYLVETSLTEKRASQTQWTIIVVSGRLWVQGLPWLKSETGSKQTTNKQQEIRKVYLGLWFPVFVCMLS